jgi:hypothetical protein
VTARHRVLISAALAGLTAASVLQAQTLPVQGGEHAAFTRLVIPIEADREWSLSGEGDTRRLELSPEPDGFDIRRSFDLIPRDRLAALASDGPALEIRLGCDCNVTTFRHLDRYLVLDIADADGAEEADFEEEDVREDPGPRRPQQPDAQRQAEREAAAAALPDLAGLLTGRGIAPAPQPSAGLETFPVAADDTTPETDAMARRLEEAAAVMAEQLARAAAAGLLEVAPGEPLSAGDPLPEADTAPLPPPPPPPVDPPVARADTEAAAPSALVVPARSPADAPPVRARTAFDIADRPAPDPETPQPRLACTGEEHGIAGWSDGENGPEGFSDGLGHRRAALFDDRDGLREEGVLALARHYLHHGFGAEALFWLSQLDRPPAELIALGHLVDGTGPARFPEVSDDTACSDEEFLLRYLADAVPGRITQGQASRLQLAFARLPAPLRARFGPDLARALAADGRPDTARNIRDMLGLSGQVPAAELIGLDLDLGFETSMEQTREALALALRDDGAAPAATMARALAFDRERALRPDPARLMAADALLRETPAGPDSDRLWREIAASRAALGQIDAAIAMIEGGRSRDGETWLAAVTGIVADRVAAGDTAALLILAHLFGADWTASGSETGRIRAAAAALLRADDLEAGAALMESGGPQLILPAIGEASPPRPATNAWAARDWQEATAAGGAREEIATRMAAREALPAEGAEAREAGLDLDVLTQQLEDSRILREALTEVLGPGSRNAQPATEAP